MKCACGKNTRWSAGRARCGLVGMVLALSALGGCQASKAGTTSMGTPDASLRSLTQRDQIVAKVPSSVVPGPGMSIAEQEAWVRQSALNLEEVLRQAEQQPGASTTPTQQPSQPAATRVLSDAPKTVVPGAPAASGAEGSPGVSLEGALAQQQASVGTNAIPSETGAATQAETTPLVELARSMASLLRQRDAHGKALMGDAAALTPLVSLDANALRTLDQADDTRHALHALAKEDRATLAQARDRVLGDSKNAPAELVGALRALPAPGSSVVITKAALCSRVEGFGRFDPFPSNTFVAGEPIRAVVYVQLADFGTRPAREGDPVQRSLPLGEQVSVDLTQEISLFHDPDGLLAWHRPADIVVETSRTKRRDFYTVQQIELPPTLSIGRYNLKVTIVDRVTGAQAEHVLGIDVVADASLVR